MGLGLMEIIIGVLVLLFGGAWFRGNAHKRQAEKQAERAEKAEVEGVLLKEQNNRLNNVQKIKDEAYDKEREINESSSVERVPLGTNGVHDGTAGSGSSDL